METAVATTSGAKNNDPSTNQTAKETETGEMEETTIKSSENLKSLRQFSFWFGEGATKRLELLDISNSTELEASEEMEAFHELAKQKELAKEAAAVKQIHVIFVVDSTGSMGEYLVSLNKTLVQLNAVIHVMFPDSASISIFAYKDYTGGGEVLSTLRRGSYSNLLLFVERLWPNGGADIPEASKTAFNALFEHFTKKKKAKWDKLYHHTIVFHYTDAPPHHQSTNQTSDTNFVREKKALSKETPGFDWCDICRSFRSLSDKVHIFTLAPTGSPGAECGASFYALLGDLVVLDDISPNNITRATMNIFLQLVGQNPLASSAVDDEQKAVLNKYCHVSFKNPDEVFASLLNDVRDNGRLCNENQMKELICSASRLATFQPPVPNTQLRRQNGIYKPPLLGLHHDLNSLLPRFKTDSQFRASVFRAMKDLVLPQNVMALTHNAILGRLWRLCCTMREDKRLDPIMRQMGNSVQSKALSTDERNRLKQWLEASYDHSSEINDQIKKEVNSNKSHRCTSFYVLDAFASSNVPDVDALRSLARCPTSSVLSQVQNVLSHIILQRNVHDGDITSSLPVDSNGNHLYLPYTFDDYDIFTMIPHLLQPGSKYSLKPAAMVAILCTRSSKKSDLAQRAHRFLTKIRGKWLPPMERIDRDEFIAYSFTSLMVSAPQNALKSDERTFYHRLYELWRYKRGRLEWVDDITCTFKPNIEQLTPDLKSMCRGCGLRTSTTLLCRSNILDRPNMCGVCLWRKEAPTKNIWTRPRKGEPYYCGDDDDDDDDDNYSSSSSISNDFSHMTECTKCSVIYAVLGPADLGVWPKCHYCRFGGIKRSKKMGAPFLQCTVCQSKWCRPDREFERENDTSAWNFICPVCSSSIARKKEMRIKKEEAEKEEGVKRKASSDKEDSTPIKTTAAATTTTKIAIKTFSSRHHCHQKKHS